MKENFEAKDTPCIACGLMGEGLVCYHHLKTQGAHKELKNEKWNLIPVCKAHHKVFHGRGTEYMSTKFNRVKKFLLDNGWKFCETRKKWVRYET